jgi:hypothetical protein
VGDGDTHGTGGDGATDSRPGAEASRDGQTVLWISPKAFYRFQFAVVTLLILLGTIHYVYAGVYGEDFIMKLSKVFDVDRENSIPTVFAIFNLLIASMLLFAIHLHSKNCREPDAVYWLILSIIFLMLSVDEGASLHERASGLKLFKTWLVYGALFSLAVFLFFIPFLRRLDRRTAVLFIIAGGLFVTGAVGLEFFGGWKARNDMSFTAQALRVCEEALELYGIAIFNCTLFGRIASKNIVVTLVSKPRTLAR